MNINVLRQTHKGPLNKGRMLFFSCSKVISYIILGHGLTQGTFEE